MPQTNRSQRINVATEITSRRCDPPDGPLTSDQELEIQTALTTINALKDNKRRAVLSYVPPIEVDLDLLAMLAGLQCTNEEIATHLGVSISTLERRVREDGAIAEAMQRGKANGKLSVRRAQMKMLEAGNATMGIWLGKQILGQRDDAATSTQVQVAILADPGASQLAAQIAIVCEEDMR